MDSGCKNGRLARREEGVEWCGPDGGVTSLEVVYIRAQRIIWWVKPRYRGGDDRAQLQPTAVCGCPGPRLRGIFFAARCFDEATREHSWIDDWAGSGVHPLRLQPIRGGC
jgi:hypothetical protein